MTANSLLRKKLHFNARYVDPPLVRGDEKGVPPCDFRECSRKLLILPRLGYVSCMTGVQQRRAALPPNGFTNGSRRSSGG
jgi:hypothetical protein